MQWHHFPGMLIRLLEATMNRVQFKERVSRLMSESFESHSGLWQGEGLQCLLFNIALEGIIRGAGLDNDIRGTIPYWSLKFLGFAYDIDIIGKTTAKMCEAYIRLKREAAKIGLRKTN